MAIALAAACDTRSRSIDPFDIPISLSTGAVVSAAQFDDLGPLPVVIDTLSPVTIIDPGPEAPIVRRRVELTLFGLAEDTSPTVPRARFGGTTAFELHTCGDRSTCSVGLGENTLEIAGVVGSDVLSRNAVTIDFQAGTMQMSPDISGTNLDRRRACEAEFPGTFAGGGTLAIGGDDERFPGQRAVVRTCLAPGEGIASRDQGENALLVLSTGMPISLLSESAYERYRAKFPGVPTLSELPEELVATTSGPASLRIAEIPGAAFVGQVRGERGACRELYANRIMAAGGCTATGVRDCPCRADENNFCRAGAAILNRGTVKFAVVGDQDPAIQALRDELRPGLPEVDGLLSARELRHLRVALDYPNGRIFMRCQEPGACVTRPVVATQAQADAADDVCPEDPGPIDAGVDAAM